MQTLKIKNVLVLRMDSTPDMMGDTYDPAGITIHSPMSIIWCNDLRYVRGQATMRQEGMDLIADLEIFTHQMPYDEILKLVPAVCGTVVKADYSNWQRRHVLLANITEISLSPHGNYDNRIPALSQYVSSGPTQKPCTCGGDKIASTHSDWCDKLK